MFEKTVARHRKQYAWLLGFAALALGVWVLSSGRWATFASGVAIGLCAFVIGADSAERALRKAYWADRQAR